MISKSGEEERRDKERTKVGVEELLAPLVIFKYDTQHEHSDIMVCVA